MFHLPLDRFSCSQQKHSVFRNLALKCRAPTYNFFFKPTKRSVLGNLFSLATLPLLVTCQKKVRCQNIPNSLRWQEAFGENLWKGLEIWLHKLLSISSSLYNWLKRNIPLLMNVTSHLFGAQLLSPKGFMWNFITTSKTEILLEALKEASNIVLELCTYQQSKEAIPQDFIHINTAIQWISNAAAALLQSWGGFNPRSWKPQLLSLSFPKCRV